MTSEERKSLKLLKLILKLIPLYIIFWKHTVALLENGTEIL